MRIASLFALALGIALGAPRAVAQPILSVNMTEIDVPSNGGVGAPTVFGSNPIYSTGGTNPLNGAYGAYGNIIGMWALATGTNPAGGFSYVFFVNGTSIGSATNAYPTVTGPPGVTPVVDEALYPQGVSWTPPQPGTYYLSCTASDGAHTATSLAVEYFATGVSIVSPVTNSIVPVGSSVIVQAAAAIPSGAVSKVLFTLNGGPTTGTVLGTSTNYPYSIIYTPAGPAGAPTNYIYATAYLADGVTVYATTTTPVAILPVAPVTPITKCSIGSPAQTTPPTTIPIPDYIADSSAFIPVEVNVSTVYTITKVELYVNGVLYGSTTALPYNFEWQPTVGGTYNLTALAYDNKNNVIASTTSTTPTLTPSPTTVIIGSLPSVAITSPNNGATLSGGAITAITATATDNNVDISGNPIAINQVQFYQDGGAVGTAPGIAGVSIYTITFTPVQKINATTGAAEGSVLTAIATDALGFQGVSPGVDVTVTAGGSSGSTVLGTPPTVSLTAPTANANVTVNSNVTLSANATAPNGNVASISFLVDSVVLSTASKYPYSVTWVPQNLGFYTIVAQVIDNLGDKANSAPITVYVVAEPPPTVSISSPGAGSIETAGTAFTITATAASSTGTIASVQFFENGISIGTVTTPPYSVTFTPTSTGIYSLSAIATDSSGETTTSSSVVMEAAPTTGGQNTTTYFGNYQGLTDSGYFAFVVADGVTGTYIGVPTYGATSAVTYMPDITVSSAGTFSQTNRITGTADSFGISGTLLPGNETYIGAAPVAGSVAVNAGLFTGSIVGQAGSQVTAIVGVDGEIMVYVGNGSFTDAAYGAAGSLDSNGNFTLVSAGNNTITGSISPTTGFVNATVSGSGGGTVLASKISGGTFSDGTLRNLSTRGDVGAGADEIVAGFYVSGTSNKNLLIRAVGPTLSQLGISGALSATQLTIYQGSTVYASNTGWSSTTANASVVTAAEAQSGAFTLPSGSADSALVGSFAPGAYTATVAGVGSATGVGLVEVYDLDSYVPFTANKLIDVSTRGNVGSGNDVLIGGFVVNGSTPKKLLIRGVGPGLGAVAGITGYLPNPHLLLFDSTGAVIRENYTWGSGNDVGLFQAAEKASGAFAFATGSADSAILTVLNPGTYTVEVSGAGTTSGIALVEIYEVP